MQKELEGYTKEELNKAFHILEALSEEVEEDKLTFEDVEKDMSVCVLDKRDMLCILEDVKRMLEQYGA